MFNLFRPIAFALTQGCLDHQYNQCATARNSALYSVPFQVCSRSAAGDLHVKRKNQDNVLRNTFDEKLPGSWLARHDPVPPRPAPLALPKFYSYVYRQAHY